MQDQLRVALIQSDLVWEDPKQNRKLFSDKMKQISESTDIIVLPEMFTSGFTMDAKTIAETMDGKTVKWMKKKAAKMNAALVGSLVIQENNKYFNRLLFVEPSGEIKHYDKRHTFTLAGEDKIYSAGTQKLLVDFRGWRISPLVCYDLRFPVWARNTEDYDVLLYVANWPKPRILAWDALLKARAIENMSYCIGVNRVGIDQGQNEYSGNSAVYDVLGNMLSTIKPNKEQVEVVTLERNHINYYRNKLKFLNDRDTFNLE